MLTKLMGKQTDSRAFGNPRFKSQYFQFPLFALEHFLTYLNLDLLLCEMGRGQVHTSSGLCKDSMR